ncbi:argininosuccinate lyase [Antarctobacter sp.]
MRLLAILGLLALAACGADGEPETPEGPTTSGPGISVTVTGTAEVGIKG